ncbi:MAG: SDR family oxidoreductase [Chitinophagaceae bacterium]
MDLKIQHHLFVVGGATSGFGRAIAELLVSEGAEIIAVARNREQLEELQLSFPGQVEIISGDITRQEVIKNITEIVSSRQLHGILVNAGGPPAMTVLDSKLEDWDQAYRTVLRWKVDLTQNLVSQMMQNNYGRILFIESASVKQPMENLVLSTSFRLAAVGYVKTLSQEIGPYGITVNVLAPGYHDTAAMNRIVEKKKQQTGVSEIEARNEFIKTTRVGFIGDAKDLASLAAWLLSPHSRYLTGQTLSVDGGTIKGIMG